MVSTTEKARESLQRVMVFGVFDGLHEGHRRFLVSARERGDELIVVVARDEQVRLLKNKAPRFDEKERVRAIRASKLVDRVALGDRKQGAYGIIRRYRPNIICLGYDQRDLAADLTARICERVIVPIRMIRLGAHRPATFKSSRLP